MLQAPIPGNDQDRLQELWSYGILDSPEEEAFDDIGALVRDLAGTAIGIISLVDENRQWFKSCIGLEAKQTPRNISFCGHTILQRTPLIIEDALQDERFCDNPLVLQKPNIRFYAGFPLISANGLALGSLCAVDQQPRQLSSQQVEALERLARLVVQQMELKRQSRLLEHSQQARQPEPDPGISADPLALLTSRDQLLSMLELMVQQQDAATFGLLRLEFKDWRRIRVALDREIAEAMHATQLKRLQQLLPANASCAALGEQEYLLLVPFLSSNERLEETAKTITQTLHLPIAIGPHLLSSQVAVGAALFQNNYSSTDALLRDVEIALRNAARQPGSHYSSIDLASRIQAQQDLELESELRHGLSLGQLEPHFQPLFDLKTRAVVGFEALARWRSQSGELLLPSAFLPAAERAELMADLDRQMIVQAIACSHELAQVLPSQPQLLSLNLSSPLLESAEQLQKLHSVLDHNPLPRHWRLQLEVLEGHLQQNEALLQEHLQSLHRRGIELAIDDFGTGYSSLSRLNSFPFTTLKVDMSFVKLLNAGENASNRILEVIQALAASLGLHTTAEGIETEEQLQWLQEHGFEWGQGYLIAKPMSLMATLDFLRSRGAAAVIA
jgi:EAL domain-containing protein (putative c-di-GMP-specific phosphodiesterase class I)/GAF domain-containing protein